MNRPARGCQMSNVPCRMSNEVDQITHRPNWVIWSFDNFIRHSICDIRHLTTRITRFLVVGALCIASRRPDLFAVPRRSGEDRNLAYPVECASPPSKDQHQL